MTTFAPPQPVRSSAEDTADRAVALVRRWLAEADREPVDASARRLAGVLGDPDGLAFTTGFVDGVIRPEDNRVAARNLAGLAPRVPRFLPAPLRAAVRAAGVLGLVAPGVVIPLSRVVLRRMVRHLIVDAGDRRLGTALRRIRGNSGDVRVNVNLLGEAILGEREAQRRLEGTRALLARPDVDYVSIKVSSTVAPHGPWGFEEAVDAAVAALLPLYRLASADGKFINLDMEEYRDLDLTLAVFTRLLEQPEFHALTAGIVLQAYLPDSIGAMERLQDWAAARVAGGGAPIKVRVVKGANLPMERVDAEVHGWPLATWGSKADTDASYKAILDRALQPEHVANVTVGVAGHNLFDVAWAWTLAQDRGVTTAIDFEMLLGMAAAQAAVVRRTVGSTLLYVPVVHPAEFSIAIAYLIRRLDEGASQENFMSAVFDLHDDASLFAREQQRFLDSIVRIPALAAGSNRTQDRSLPQAAARRRGFANVCDTDPSVAANRRWADGIRARMAGSTLGLATRERNTITTGASLDDVLARGVEAGAGWRDLGPDGRAEILHRAGDMLQDRRAELLEVMGAEAGKVLEQGDPEVSEAVDFAHYYAESGRRLDAVDGARFEPARLTVVTPPWNFPVAIPAGSALAALAAGSPVVIKPAAQSSRCGAVMCEALWDAGVPRDVLQYVQLSERNLGRRLIASPLVDRVILTGGFETAERFRSFRPDLPLLAETSGKNAIIVTPSADLDLAALDVAHSAFGHAGQKCSAASLVVLVGSVVRSERFRRQLLDAVGALRVGEPADGSSRIGPLIGPADGKLLRALTTLDPGESWALEPRALDATGQRWTPGIRDGVKPGSESHLTEFFGPVLGIMAADTLDDAIGYVNAVDYGLTSGLHSLNDAEIETWLERVEAGNLYVNRGTTGAIVQRQPFGGWKRSAVGPGTKAGGPNYLLGLGSWHDAAPAAGDGDTDPLTRSALSAARAAGASESDVDWLAEALATDRDAWADEFGVAHDPTDLAFEHNVLRYRPVPVTVRDEGGRLVELFRVIAAGVRAGAVVTVSAPVLAPAVREYLDAVGMAAHTEDAAAWAARAAALAEEGGRVRLIDGALIDSAPSLAVYAGNVVSAGRVELLPFLREQAISVCAHRFGMPRRRPGAAPSSE